MKKTIMLFVLAAVAACAKSPDAIAPVAMGDAYQNVSCSSASRMLERERAALAALDYAQRGAVAGDAIGVFLIGVPVSSLSGGDREGAIATAKGKILALETRMLTCG